MRMIFADAITRPRTSTQLSGARLPKENGVSENERRSRGETGRRDPDIPILQQAKTEYAKLQ
jgi:hypothetical protein